MLAQVRVGPQSCVAGEGLPGIIVAIVPGAAGCAVISGSNASFGEPFNAAGGGVFAMLWDDQGLHFCKPKLVC